MSLPSDLWAVGKEFGATGWTGDSRYTYTLDMPEGKKAVIPREVTLADDRGEACATARRLIQAALGVTATLDELLAEETELRLRMAVPKCQDRSDAEKRLPVVEAAVAEKLRRHGVPVHAPKRA